MARVYVGNLEPRTSERELEDEFRIYGVLRSVWVARKPPGYAFIEFDDKRDAVDAIEGLNGKNGWRVEMSRKSAGGATGYRSRDVNDTNCYECGKPGHFARECRLRIGGLGSGVRGYGRSHSPVPRYRSSPSYGHRYNPLPRSRSPMRYGRSRSPVRYGRSRSPVRYGRSRSPTRYGRSLTPPSVHDHTYSPRSCYRSPDQYAKASTNSRSSPIHYRQPGSSYGNGSPYRSSYGRDRYRSP